MADFTKVERLTRESTFLPMRYLYQYELKANKAFLGSLAPQFFRFLIGSGDCLRDQVAESALLKLEQGLGSSAAG